MPPFYKPKIKPLLPSSARKTRVWEIDFLRGFCILLMIFDHAMFDFMYLPEWTGNFFQINNPLITALWKFAYYEYWETTWRISIRVVVVCVFLFLSGISGTFSRNNGTRAVKLSAAAIGLSAATIFIDSVASLGVTILFGVLHCLALSVVLYALIRFAAGRYAKYFYLAFGILLTVWGVLINYYWIPEMTHYPQSVQDVLTLVMGFEYYGADCFGLVPYTGIFFMGAYAGETVYKSKRSLLPRLDGKWNKPLRFVGRNTIWVYLLHQPVILGLVALICTALGYRFF